MTKPKIAVDIDDTIVFHPEVKDMSGDEIGKWFDREDVYDNKSMDIIDLFGMKLLSSSFDIVLVSKCYKSHLAGKIKMIDKCSNLTIVDNKCLVKPEFIDFGIDYRSDYDIQNNIEPGHDTGKGDLSWASVFVDDSMDNLTKSKVEHLYQLVPQKIFGMGNGFESEPLNYSLEPIKLEDGREVVRVGSIVGIYHHINERISTL